MKIKQRCVTRRALIAAATIGLCAVLTNKVQANTRPKVSVWKDPNCGCCSAWIQYMRRSGFDVSATDTPNLQAIKQQLGVPQALAACHTATIGDYVIEGHVPEKAIEKLLAEKPEARGIAVPGMPSGSPGMEGGTPDTYDVILFGHEKPVSFQRFRGHVAI